MTLADLMREHGEKWEYKTVPVTDRQMPSESFFNQLGEQGWELICVTGAWFVFIRAK